MEVIVNFTCSSGGVVGLMVQIGVPTRSNLPTQQEITRGVDQAYVTSIEKRLFLSIL